MAFCDCTNHLLAAIVHFQTLLEVSQGSARARQVSFIDDHQISGFKHANLLKLQSAAVVRAHYQDLLVHQSSGKRKIFLTDSGALDEDHVESLALENFQTKTG